MTDSKRQDMLRKVRGLLAKASDPKLPEGESELFRAKADELMLKYAIDQWMVEQEQEGTHQKPILRMIDFQWYWDSYDNPARSALYKIWYNVAAHCRIKIIAGKADTRDERPAVGMEADLDYFDLLFTNIMIQMLAQIDPHPVEARSYEENIAVMRESGMDWNIITQRLIKSGLLKDPTPEEGEWYPRRSDVKTFQPARYALSQKVVATYRRWCKETNRQQTYTNVITYREQFSDGFSMAVAARLRAMARGSEDAYDGAHEANSAALAIRDIKVVVEEAVWEFFPDLRPHPDDCDCDDCHTYKCDDSNCQRPRCVERRKPVKIKYSKIPERAVDHQAHQAGREAGKKVKLTATNPSGGLGKTPELDK